MKTERRQKGAFVFGLAFFMIVGLIVVVSAFLFIIFFKVHVTSIAVDVDSINRYQEIPTTVLGTLLLVGDSTQEGLTPEADGREKKEINCFRGDGPAGSHGPNEDLCIKRIAFFFNKFALGAGGRVLDKESDLVINLKAALPTTCYSLSLRSSDSAEPDKLESDVARCLSSPRFNERYPIPVFADGAPAVAAQTLVIGSSFTSGQEILVNWPRYETEFEVGGGE